MKRLLKVTAMTGLLTLLKMAMGFVIAKVVAIYTGPTGLAMLGQVQSLVGSLNGIINAPAGSGVVRYTAENKAHGFDACAPWWRASLQWILIISVIAIPLGVLLAKPIAAGLFQDKELAWIVVATVCLLPLAAIGTLFNSVINGQELYRRYVGLGMLTVLISSGMMLVMIGLYNIQGALLAASVQAALIGLVMLFANIRQPWFKLRYWWGAVDPKARKQIGGYMLMASASALTVPVSLILVRNILIDQVGWDGAGQWQAVWKISEVYLGIITIALGTYFLPRLSKIECSKLILLELNKTAITVIPIVIAIASIIFLLRDTIVLILFTNSFYEARNLFAIQLLGDILKISSWVYAYPLLSRGVVKLFVFIEFSFSLIFVCLVFFFVKFYGLQGATIAYALNYLLCLIFVLFKLRRIVK
ncbi:O-antigen translocase [Shewanella xiamenensis]|uniref:O-antigen translocase n=1 Tax=Shewanella xiamenensis TaxID=332186 RepID=UPI00214FB21F|nr:O-antigen translocase [Shewanella xiamenensis]MCR4535215.1 O-antigen translocase [Shewanella xiamenensis]